MKPHLNADNGDTHKTTDTHLSQTLSHTHTLYFTCAFKHTFDLYLTSVWPESSQQLAGGEQDETETVCLHNPQQDRHTQTEKQAATEKKERGKRSK